MVLRGEERYIMKKVSFVVVGAGSRGGIYAKYILEHPDEAEVVAVCEPRDEARERLADAHNIPANMRFKDWRDIADRPRLADAVCICTQDSMHKDPAVAFAKLGYHILLEKPLAPTVEDCKVICDAAKEYGVMLAVCHVLRYTQRARLVKRMIDEGRIGRIHSLQQLEPVGYWHQAHSFVRGNWRNEAESSFMLLAKSCHDLDLINYFMPSQCNRVSSFGSLSHFTHANQPKGAADRCTDCPESIESQCPYSALKIYLRDRADAFDTWPANILTMDATEESVRHAVETGPYGRCVYACDNDVVDHQVVNMEFLDGATATFTMCAFNKGGGREIYIMGDRGTLRYTDAGVELYDYLTDTTTDLTAQTGDGQITSGHDGGDTGLMESFMAALRTGAPSLIASGPDISYASHAMVFAAERSRRANAVVEIDAQ